MRPQNLLTGLATASLGLAMTSTAAAQTLDFEVVASGFSSPLYVTAPPGDDRLFVVEQNSGFVEIIESGVVLGTPYLQLKSITTVTSGGERGFLGLAFHPNYSENGHVFVSYTGAGGRSKLARLTVDPANPYVVDPASFDEFFDWAQPFSNHNGGCIQFGPDGYLYYGTGDGGSGNDPGCRAQKPDQLLGKMLRLDVDVLDTTGTYGIPVDNPYVGDPGTRDEIFHFGLRNPWRFSFDRQTGDLYIADVGQDAREEIDVLPALNGPENFGWKVMEGLKCNSTSACPTGTPLCNDPAYTLPVWQIQHQGTGWCSITGGYVYRGPAIPSIQGRYFFTDICSRDFITWEWDGSTGVMNEIDVTSDINSSVSPDPSSVNSFGEDSYGEMYVVSPGGGGRILKVVPESAPPVPAPAFQSKFDQLSLAGGGVHSLTLNAGASNAGKPYVVFGSFTGTAPGIVLDGMLLPLNPDNYSVLMLNNLNTGPFKRTFGTLDAGGRADALIDVAPGTNAGALTGMTLNHAYAVFEPSATVGFVSNATELTLLP